MKRPSGDDHWTRRRPDRVRRGTRAGGAKLSEEEIEEIRFMAHQMGSAPAWLAERYQVSRVTIWRHLSRATDRCADVNT